jgi:hypothetical protein
LRPPELAPVATCEVPVRSVADASTLLADPHVYQRATSVPIIIRSRWIRERS